MRARDRQCPGCGAKFCRLPGSGNHQCCSAECSADLLRKAKSSSRAKDRARLLSAQVEDVNPYKVFSLDGWTCYICGDPTPRRLRGTCESDAPELEHVVPLAGNGPHSYANTRCACRHCNGAKGDMTLSQWLRRRLEGA
ncbi:HNH endonuclease [Variovorax sp. Varisp41]|uniref:HNH endonuclease n=1 Tax=Variovorax sp. Varisp41 TaxID=3243033 RepID=UPI0039B529C3